MFDSSLSSERFMPPQIITLHVDVSEMLQERIYPSAQSLGRELSFGLEIAKFIVALAKNICKDIDVSMVG